MNMDTFRAHLQTALGYGLILWGSVYPGLSYAQEPCTQQNLSGTKIFYQDGLFVPPQGTSDSCPLLISALIVGGGGRGGDAYQKSDEPSTCYAGGGGGAGQIVTVKLIVTHPVAIKVGGPGLPSSYGSILSIAGENGADGNNGGAGGAGSSYGGNAGTNGSSNGTTHPLSARNKNAPHLWGRQIIPPETAYTPIHIGDVTFTSASLSAGAGGQSGKATPVCAPGGGGGGILINNQEPALAPPHEERNGIGFGAGGGGGDKNHPKGSPGTQGIVYVEW